MTTRRAAAALACALLAAACNAPPTKPGVAPTQSVLRPGFGKAKAPPAAKTKVSTTPDGAAITLQAMADEPPQAVKQAEGMQYVSADGLVTAVVPPGALDRDAKLRIVRADTSAIALSEDQIPGIAFAVDFGGARLKPGARMTVTAPVDPRFVDEGPKLDPDFSPQKYNLRQNADGLWLMDMAVRGPALIGNSGGSGVTATRPEVGLAETYPLPAFLAAWPTAEEVRALGPAKAYGLLRATAPAAPDPTETAAIAALPALDAAAGLTVVKQLPFGRKSVLKSIEDTPEATLRAGGEFFTCTMHHLKCKTELMAGLRDVILYNRTIQAGKMPPAEQVARVKGYQGIGICTPQSVGGTPGPTVNSQVHVTYTSDDERVAGTDAANETVRFAADGEPDTAVDGTTDAAGNAKDPNDTVPGVALLFQAFTDRPEFKVGPAVGRTAAVGQPVVELTIPKNSPYITLRFSTFQAVKGTATFQATVDGEKRTLTVPLDVPAAGGDEGFFVKVPDDADHAFKLLSGVVTGSSDVGIDVPADGRTVHRNGSYALDVRLIPIGAK